MSWQAVARKDFEDAVRSRWLWALSALFVLVFSTPAIAKLYFGGGPGQGRGVVQLFIPLMKEVTAILVPLMAVVVAYAAITRERESGTIKLLLSLPHSRSDVVFGKVVGRSAVVALPVLVGFFVSLVVMLPASSAFDFFKYFQFALLTAFFGVVFVGLSVGVSAAAESNQQAILGAGGAFAVFTFAWSTATAGLVDGVRKLLGDVGIQMSTTTRYEIVLFLKLMNPLQAYRTLVDSLFVPALAARKQMFGFLIFGDPRASKALGDSLALPFTDPFVVVYMLFWLFVPVAVGLSVFRARDL